MATARDLVNIIDNTPTTRKPISQEEAKKSGLDKVQLAKPSNNQTAPTTPPKKKGGGGGSNIPQSTPAGTPPLNEPLTSNVATTATPTGELGKPKSPSIFKEYINKLSESANYYLSLGGQLDYKPTRTSPYTLYATGQTGVTSGRGTTMYAPLTEEMKSPEQKAQTKIDKLIFESSIKAEKITREEEMQSIDVKARQKQLDELNKEIKKESTKIQLEYERDVIGASTESSFLIGGVVGGVSIIAPPIGATLAVLNVGSAAINSQQLKRSYQLNPTGTLKNIGAGIAGGVVGGGLTTVTAIKTKSLLVSVNREFIELNKISSQEIVTGAKTFPEAPFGTPATAQARLKTFLSNPKPLPIVNEPIGVYHVSPGTFDKLTKVTPGTSELPGLYVAPEASIYFSKVQEGLKLPTLFGLETTSILEKSPSINRIYPRNIKLIGQGNLAELRKFFESNKVKQGTAYVINIKPEIEAGLPVGTVLKQVGTEFYTKYKGQNIPINRYIASEGEAIGVTIKDLNKYSYKGIESYKAITPEKVLSSVSIKKELNKYQIPSYKSSAKGTSLKPIVSTKDIPSVKLPSTKKVYYGGGSVKTGLPSTIEYKSPEITKTIQYPTPKYTKRTPAIYPPFKTPQIKIPPTITKPREEFRYKPSKLTSGVFGYRTFVKRFGKYKALSGIRDFGSALKLGAEVSKKSTIASFKVEKTSQRVQGTQTAFKPSSSLFRGYKINRGKRINLFNEFIEKRGKRLTTQSEIRDLLGFRKKKKR